MFGENDGEAAAAASGGTRAKSGGSNPSNGLDYQLISPMGSFDPGQSPSAGDSAGIMPRGQKTKIPTW